MTRMPNLPVSLSERSKSRNLPPPSPSLSRKHSWKAAIPLRGHRSRSNSEVDDDSIVGGTVTPIKLAGVSGGGGGGGGGGGEEDGRNGAHYAYAISRYCTAERVSEGVDLWTCLCCSLLRTSCTLVATADTGQSGINSRSMNSYCTHTTVVLLVKVVLETLLLSPNLATAVGRVRNLAQTAIVHWCSSRLRF